MCLSEGFGPSQIRTSLGQGVCQRIRAIQTVAQHPAIYIRFMFVLVKIILARIPKSSRSRKKAVQWSSMPIVADQIELQTYRDDTWLRLSNVEKFSDGSGFRCDLAVRSGGFTCQYPFYFDADLLADAIDSLRRMITGLPGLATIKGRYEADFLCFELNKLGHLFVPGELHEHGELSQSLKFAFKTDQTVLAPLAQELAVLHGA